MRHHVWYNQSNQVIHEIKIAPDGAVFGIDGKPFQNIGTFKTDEESEAERKKRLGRGHAYLYFKEGDVSRHVDFLSKVYWEKNKNISERSKSWQRGQDVEVTFGDVLERMGIEFRPATKEEQIYKHFDFVTEKGTFDVKAMKNVSRSDNNPQNEFIWVEFKNVRGDKGWLCSEVDFIAFEQLKSFLVVKRASLLEKAESLCDLVNLTKKGGMEALYRGYQRHGRKDLISMIKLSDVLSLSHKNFSKIKS